VAHLFQFGDRPFSSETELVRLAIVSDIHGNLTAFEAVLADLRLTAPDLIWHGGDLAHAGSSPAEVVDRLRDIGWPGVLGNTDEMLFDSGPLRTFASQSAAMAPLLPLIEEMASATSEALGEERLAWLRELPLSQVEGQVALVHASPATLWRAPYPEASDSELESVYSPLGRPLAVYGHVHRSYVRALGPLLTVANAGSVSLSHDGDPRASYLLIDDATPTIRRVEYDVEREIKALSIRRFPHWEWTAKMLAVARPQMP
jgi:predicted phosphodiesterase